MTSSHRPRALSSATSDSLTTVNSPDRFDFTYRLRYSGSMLADTPMMLAMVAVGAMAMQLELRMPYFAMRARKPSQSSVLERSSSTGTPRSRSSRSTESSGSTPLSHRLPLKVE